METCEREKTYAGMFTAASFVTAETWEQLSVHAQTTEKWSGECSRGRMLAGKKKD